MLLVLFLLSFGIHQSAFVNHVQAYPPAPHHLFYGMVRDEFGNPIATGAEIIFEVSSGVKIKTTVVPFLQPGVNFRLEVPMDSGIASDLYKPTAQRPTVPFRIRVQVNGVIYLPIEMTGNLLGMGQPGQRTRLNLTLGRDTNGDGLPDAWQRLSNADINKIKPNEVAANGMTYLQNYLAGTYAFDPKDGFTLSVSRMNGARPVLTFTAITGRTYTLLGSADLKGGWTTLNFKESGQPDDTMMPSYSAGSVRPMEIEHLQPTNAPPMRFFKLMLQ